MSRRRRKPLAFELLGEGPFKIGADLTCPRDQRRRRPDGPEEGNGLSAAAVVAGLAVYSLFGSFGYLWVAVALVLVAAGMRIVGVVAGVNVLRGLPENRTSIGAALVDTATEVASGVGIAITGTISQPCSPATSPPRTGAPGKPRSSERR